MDGLEDTVPLGKPEEEPDHQYTIFEWMAPEKEEVKETEKAAGPYCKIYDWRRDNSRLYKELKENN